MRLRLMIGWLVVLSLVAALGYAQQPPGQGAAAATQAVQAPPPAAQVVRLSLADALDLARRSSPALRTVMNDRWITTSQERSSLLNLLTPSLSFGYGARHTAAGTSSFFQGGLAFVQPSAASTGSSWSLSLDYTLSGSTVANRGLAAAQARATQADVAGAQTTLETGVRTAYLNLLQSRAQEALTHQALERAVEALNLAQARYAVGQATLIDVRRAEVDSGTAAVNVLTASQAVNNATLSLFQVIGVPAPENATVEPTDTFSVTPPTFNQDDLINLALEENPTLKALRAREASAHWSTRAAYSQYLPSLNLSGSYGGYHQSASALGVAGDSGYVPSYSYAGRNPVAVSLFVSVPLYDGLSRETQIQQARAAEDDLTQSIRAGELNLRASVTSAYLALIADYQKIALQDANKRASEEALDLATQRYRVGSGSYLELLDARLAANQADADYVTAVYDYHKAVATLENAVGRPLQ